ncbi:hypothetical protein HOLleu_02002 [Holothuria leucospilota]|uniref:Uncharacterized protein n=1 Tax=Holothuria leucospilota TaxID=206669 RepID=A0A9Q1CR61_HOLLE|nr:hypothetical protein HOLleu_02002 [Holothuria leucospilota]
MYCRTSRQNLGFCYHRLIVSNSDMANNEHYQIVGSYQQIYDGDTLLETKFENGITDEEPPYQKIQVANGRTWCQVTNSIKIGDLFFFVKKTTEPSITDNISTIFVKADDRKVSKEEQFWNCNDSTSVRVPFNEVRTHTSAWRGNSYMQTYFWRAPSNLN